jgi:hypothetical protein
MAHSSNVAVADCFSIRHSGHPETPALRAPDDHLVGIPETGWGNRYLAFNRTIAPNSDLLVELMIGTDPTIPAGRTFRVMAEISHVRLSARGRKWLWAYVGHKLPNWRDGDDWPGPKVPKSEYLRIWKSWRPVRAHPEGRIRCDPGVRQDIREFKV